MAEGLEGKVAVVTGGGRGIGRAIAMRLADAGARVAVCGRTSRTLETTAKKLQSLAGGFGRAYRLDVRDRADVDKTIARIAAECSEGKKPRIDLLVNNAGVIGATPIASNDDTSWNDIIDTNLNGAMRVTRAALRAMPSGARVVNISSVLGKTGAPAYGAYCASKHALVGWTRALALELAPRRITANAVCAGWVDTDMAMEMLVDLATRQAQDPQQLRRGVEERIPLGRFVAPVEVAELVAFLCGEGAAMITGQALSVCGGQSNF
jgi:NAD(P)-dependent dehydrogenase (short-subunit alcohol dehydrogenase family)